VIEAIDGGKTFSTWEGGGGQRVRKMKNKPILKIRGCLTEQNPNLAGRRKKSTSGVAMTLKGNKKYIRREGKEPLFRNS